jgi:hypothetical protein
VYLWYCRHHESRRQTARASRSSTPAPIASRNVSTSTLRLDSVGAELPAEGASIGGVFRVAGAECTFRGIGFAAWTAGLAFFFTAGFGWRASPAASAFAGVTVCFGVVACVGGGLDCVDAEGEEVTGADDVADDVAGAGVTTGAGGGAGGGLEVCVLPLDEDFCS